MLLVFKHHRAEIARQVGIQDKQLPTRSPLNAALIDAVQQEAVQLVLSRRIKAAYDEFLRLLKQFRAELPGTPIVGWLTRIA